jgi:hypothetical protein
VTTVSLFFISTRSDLGRFFGRHFLIRESTDSHPIFSFQLHRPIRILYPRPLLPRRRYPALMDPEVDQSIRSLHLTRLQQASAPQLPLKDPIDQIRLLPLLVVPRLMAPQPLRLPQTSPIRVAPLPFLLVNHHVEHMLLSSPPDLNRPCQVPSFL